MANEDYKNERRWSESNPAISPEQRRYNKGVNDALTKASGWRTTTTTTTTTTSTTTTTTA